MGLKLVLCLCVLGCLMLAVTTEAKKSVVDMDEVEIQRIMDEWDVSESNVLILNFPIDLDL